MTLIAPVIPTTPLQRLRWLATDTGTMAKRELKHWVHQPSKIIAELSFPIVSVVLFGYVFGSAMVVPGGGDYREFLMPGLFAMTMMFGIAETAITVSTDVSKGVTDRFRSMPMAPSSVVLGRSVAQMINAAIGLALLIICGLVVGWQWHGSLLEAVAAVALLLLLRFALIWAGIYLGLVAGTPETAGAMFPLLFPFTMIANTFVSPVLMPSWLGAIAEWNPLSATVTASRELFHNPSVGGIGTWASENALFLALAWPALLVAIFLPLSVWRYRKLSQ